MKSRKHLFTPNENGALDYLREQYKAAPDKAKFMDVMRQVASGEIVRVPTAPNGVLLGAQICRELIIEVESVD